MTAIKAATLAVLVLLAIAGGYLDVRYRRLPNWLCLLALLAGLGLGFVAGGAAWAGSSALHAALALLVGMILFSIGAIGGGDAKYYAAFAAWLPFKFAPLLIGAVSLAGLALLVVWLPIRKKVGNSAANDPARGEFKKVPYGLAISVGAIVAYWIAVHPFA